MTTPTSHQPEPIVTLAKGISPRMADTVIIYVDDYESFGASVWRLIDAITQKQPTELPLKNISYSFICSQVKEPSLATPMIQRCLDGVLQLINNSADNSQIILFLDHEQKSFTGTELALKLKEAMSPDQLKRTGIVGFSANALSPEVKKAWQGIGKCFDKMSPSPQIEIESMLKEALIQISNK